MSNVGFTLSDSDLSKLDKYVLKNKIVNNRGKLLSHADSCYSIVKNFIDSLDEEGNVLE